MRYEFVAWYKLQIGCEFCGYKRNSTALDLDHILGDKKENISYLCGKGAPMEDILIEISKCRVLCANHHRVETSKFSTSKPTAGVCSMPDASGEQVDYWAEQQRENLTKVREAFARWREEIYDPRRNGRAPESEEICGQGD